MLQKFLNFRNSSLIAAAVTAVLTLGFLKIYLIDYSAKFKNDFMAQNYRELSTGDVFTITSKLNAYSTVLPFICMSASKNTTNFYENFKGSCEKSFLRNQITIDEQAKGGIIIQVTLTIPTSISVMVTIILFLELICLVIIGVIKSRSDQVQYHTQLQIGLLSKENEVSRYKATAATVQMLAHDVRKPFGIFQMGLGMLAKARSMEEIKTISNRLLPEVEKSLSSVNGLISDVMMVGQKFALNLEKTSIESILESCLNEAARIYPEANINYTYDLQHRYLLEVDSAKIQRVFSNIIGNAIQAVGKQGEIWITTQEVSYDSSRFIEVTLGNNGPAIVKAELSKLFEAFFTSGKSGGTGLGLAIAKEVVSTHGGRIWCESPVRADRGVEFKFLLPSSEELSQTTAKLRPTHDEIKAAMTLMSAQGGQDSVKASELLLETEIVDYARQLGRKLSLGILDDEAVYRNGVFEIIGRSPALSGVLDIHSFGEASHLLSKSVQMLPDYILCDIDLGNPDFDGFHVLQELKTKNYSGSVCVHSNRTLPDDFKRAIDLGAQAFLPKPISREHLLKFIVTHLSRIKVGDALVGVKPLVIVLDDDLFFQFAWEQVLSQDADVLVFDDPERMREKIAKDPGLLSSTCCIITDYYFGKQSVSDTDFWNIISQYNYKGPVLLSSNSVEEVTDSKFTARISKDPVTLVELSRYFKQL